MGEGGDPLTPLAFRLQGLFRLTDLQSPVGQSARALQTRLRAACKSTLSAFRGLLVWMALAVQPMPGAIQFHPCSLNHAGSCQSPQALQMYLDYLSSRSFVGQSSKKSLSVTPKNLATALASQILVDALGRCRIFLSCS